MQDLVVLDSSGASLSAGQQILGLKQKSWKNGEQVQDNATFTECDGEEDISGWRERILELAVCLLRYLAEKGGLKVTV